MSEPIPAKPLKIPKFALYAAWAVLAVFGLMVLITKPLFFLVAVALAIVWPTLNNTHVHYESKPVRWRDNDDDDLD